LVVVLTSSSTRDASGDKVKKVIKESPRHSRIKEIERNPSDFLGPAVFVRHVDLKNEFRMADQPG